MSLVLDPNRPWTDEEKEWANSAGRSAMVRSNERRFPGGKVSKGDRAGSPEPSAQFGPHGNEVREQAVYDVGGAPLPDTTLDYNTGRAYASDEEGNGVLVEPSQVGTPNTAQYANPSPWGDNGTPDDGDVDDDIAEYVQGIPNMDELRKVLTKNKIAFPKDGRREDLEDALAIGLHDRRHGTESHPGAPIDPVIYVDPDTGAEVEPPADAGAEVVDDDEDEDDEDADDEESENAE